MYARAACKRGNIEFSLLSEGVRKLALLWILIPNGTLSSGSVLLWDEPETNLNPKLFHPLMYWADQTLWLWITQCPSIHQPPG